MSVNYARLDQELAAFIKVLSTPTKEGNLYVPMPTTVHLLRRLNALCAKNMTATDFQVGEETKGFRRDSYSQLHERSGKKRDRK